MRALVDDDSFRTTIAQREDERRCAARPLPNSLKVTPGEILAWQMTDRTQHAGLAQGTFENRPIREKATASRDK